ncbi:MAG: hypothetical protein ACI8P3_003401, partial [Saprospiraceae bacterium]
MSGFAYVIRNGVKVIVRCWDSKEINKGPLELFELELEKPHPDLSNEAKAEIYTCEAVNSILGIKPYHSEEFLTEMKFEVFEPVNDKENLKDEERSIQKDENLSPKVLPLHYHYSRVH